MSEVSVVTRKDTLNASLAAADTALAANSQFNNILAVALKDPPEDKAQRDADRRQEIEDAKRAKKDKDCSCDSAAQEAKEEKQRRAEEKAEQRSGGRKSPDY